MGGAEKNQGGGGGGGGENKSNEQKSKSGGDGGKKDDGLLVLKMDLHCTGCITKCKKALEANLEGLELVKADLESNKIAIFGKVDSVKAKWILEQRMKKKVEIISPAPKKKENEGGEDKKSKENTEKKTDDKKDKEPPLTIAVLRLNLHCDGCIQKIYKTVTKTQGFHEIKFDREKELVMVKGTMDMKMLAEALEVKLKRSVVIVVPTKKENGGGVEKKEKEKEKGGGGEEDKGKGGDHLVPKSEERQFQFYPVNYGYGYGYPVHPTYGYPARYPAPPPPSAGPPIPAGWGNYQNPPGFAFSDENPNACSIM